MPTMQAGRQPQWNGLNVNVVRDATSEDFGYGPEAEEGSLVVIRFQDNTTKVVPRSELSAV